MPVLAHNPELILSLLAGIVVLVFVGLPLLYSAVSAVGYMLAGIGSKTAWWRRLAAPAAGLVACFIFLVLLSVLSMFKENAAELPPGMLVLYGAVVVAFWVSPVFIGRVLLGFSWGRAALAAVIILLLQIAVMVLFLVGLSWLSPDNSMYCR